jgi:hypothetical protein
MDYLVKKLTPLVKLGQKKTSVYYFKKGGAEYQFSKLGCVESSFTKTSECQCNLS